MTLYSNPVSIFSPPNPNPPASYVPANTTQQQLHQNNRYVTFVTTPPPTSASSVSASTTTAASTNNNGINQQGVLPQLSSVSSQIQPITTSGPPPLRIISHPPEIKRNVNSSGSCGIGVVALQQPRVQPQQPQTNGCPSPPTSVTSNVPLLGVESHQPLPVQQQPPQTRNASATTAAAPASCKETSLSQHP